MLRMGAWLGRKAKPDLKLGVCGEHGGDPDSIEFFHHSGIDYVSCSPVPRADRARRRGAGGDPRRLERPSTALSANGRMVDGRPCSAVRLRPCSSRRFSRAPLVALTSRLGLDYYMDAAPGIQALAAWDLHGWLATQPQMGQLSILLRAPVQALGLSELWTYRLGALVLLAGPVALTVVLWNGRRPRNLSALVLVAVICLNPMTIRALHLGHPEEPLGGALCAIALAAGHRRPRARRRPGAGPRAGDQAVGDLRGPAGDVRLRPRAPPRPADRRRARRRRARAAADPPEPARVRGEHEPAPRGPVDHAPGEPVEPRGPAAALRRHRRRRSSGSRSCRRGCGRWRTRWSSARAHARAAVALPARRARSRHRRWPCCALLFLVRCLLDPWNHGYYHWPFLAALACSEVRGCGRVPIATALSSAWLWIVFVRTDGLLMDSGLCRLGLRLHRLSGARRVPARRPGAACDRSRRLRCPDAATIGGWTRTPTPDRSPARTTRGAAPGRTSTCRRWPPARTRRGARGPRRTAACARRCSATATGSCTPRRSGA